jgi:GGDEF domain-containing protein
MDNVYGRLKEVEAELRTRHPQAADLGFGLSIGSAVYDPDKPESMKQFLDALDEAMYDEKGDKRR